MKIAVKDGITNCDGYTHHATQLTLRPASVHGGLSESLSGSILPLNEYGNLIEGEPPTIRYQVQFAGSAVDAVSGLIDELKVLLEALVQQGGN